MVACLKSHNLISVYEEKKEEKKVLLTKHLPLKTLSFTKKITHVSFNYTPSIFVYHCCIETSFLITLLPCIFNIFIARYNVLGSHSPEADLFPR